MATDGTYGVFGGPDTRNHVVNVLTARTTLVIEFSPTSDYEDGAWFSPDGTRLSMVIREGDLHQIAVMTLDGSRPPVATEPEEDPNAMPATWSPDGKQHSSPHVSRTALPHRPRHGRAVDTTPTSRQLGRLAKGIPVALEPVATGVGPPSGAC
ncbi:MAG: hypothetical protein R3C32_05795 [Chloroflexota bacterium]